MTVYPGAIPLETDILHAQRYSMVGLAALSSALFGVATTVNGLACLPTTPASMQVKVGPGEIYAVENLDDMAYSSLPADTAHQIVKQGINIDATTLNCPAPTSAGQSINYLIEAALSETDTDAVTLPYYNASDPSTAYSGPANSGTAQPTRRASRVVLVAKPGVAAATGTQTTPAADSGYVGLWIVTVAYGATTIISANIAKAPGAPFVPAGGLAQALAYASRAETAAGTLATKIVSPDTMAQAVQSGGLDYATASGTNTVTASLSPAPAVVNAGLRVKILVANSNTGTTTLNLNGNGAVAIQCNARALSAGMLKAGLIQELIFDGTVWQLMTPATDGTLTNTGHVRLPNGLLINWGSGVTSGTTGVTSVTFDKAFAAAPLMAVASNASDSYPLNTHATGNQSTTGMTVGSTSIASGSVGTPSGSGVAFTWIAIGF